MAAAVPVAYWLFRKAAREAEAIGLVDVSRRLKEAAKSMDEASALLVVAMKELSLFNL